MEAKISNVKIGKRKLFGFEHIIKDTRSREEEENIPDDISIGSSSSRTENAISKGAIQKSIIFKKHGLSRFSPQKLISPVKSIKNFIAKRSNNNKEESKIINNPPESPASPDRIVSGKFRLRGKYLSYYSKNEGMVITLDITECKVRLGTSEVLEDGKLKFTYFIATKDKEHCFTSFSEKSRLTSMMILHEQVQAYKSIVKALVNPVEVCLGFGVVNRRRTAMLTSATFSTVTMALTSQHRILFFQQSSTSLQEQVTWTINHPPLFIKISKTKFRIELDNGRCLIDLEDVKSGSSYWQQLFSQLCDPESTDEANAGDDHADAFNESTFLPPISPMDKPLTLAVDTEAPLTESASSSSLTLTLEPSHALLKSAEDSPKTELQTNVQVIREINDSCTIKAAIEDNTVVIHSAELSSETIAMSTTVSAPMAVKSAWVGMVDLVVNLCLCNRGQETASSTVTTNVNKSATMTTANTDALSSSTMSPRIPEADDEVTL